MLDDRMNAAAPFDPSEVQRKVEGRPHECHTENSDQRRRAGKAGGGQSEADTFLTEQIVSWRRDILEAKQRCEVRWAIDEGQAWAISFGLRTVLGLRDGAGVPPLVPDAGDEIRPTIQVTFVKPDPNDPRFRDDPLQLERPVRYDPAPAGQKLLPSPTERPMGDLSKKGSWMD
jgi:hypothetical protein